MRITRIVCSWKEAATVMLFARNGSQFKPASTPSHSQPQGSKSSESGKSNIRDYRVLTLERTSKSKFMPSAFVFPGGAISSVDHSEEWLKLYEKCGVKNLNSTLPAPVQDPELRAPMFTINRNWAVDSNVAFRICSIRETFEEAGILLCRHANDLLQRNDKKSAWKALDKLKLQEWRPAVRKDDGKFLEMCKELDLVPDIWSLHEWSCWLTPTNMDDLHHGRRYDTAFYICALPKHIDAVHDQEEIVHSKWIDPAALLEDFTEKKLWLAPPQIYELRRMCNFNHFEKLEQFAENREKHGCVRWLPVRMTFQDGIVPVLPGDDLYPVDLDIEGTRPSPEYQTTIAEGLANTKNVHRFGIPSFQDCKLYCNVGQTNQHADPKPLNEILNEK